MSKRLLQLLALLLTIGSSPPRGDDDGDSALGLVSSGTLTVCTDVPYPPMEFEDPDAEGGFTGFDIELMRAIADDLGLGLAVATPAGMRSRAVWPTRLATVTSRLRRSPSPPSAKRTSTSPSRTSRASSPSSSPTTAAPRPLLISA